MAYDLRSNDVQFKSDGTAYIGEWVSPTKEQEAYIAGWNAYRRSGKPITPTPYRNRMDSLGDEDPGL